MKNIATIIFVFLAFSLSGCSETKSEEKKETENKEITKKNIMGDGKIRKIKPGESLGGI